MSDRLTAAVSELVAALRDEMAPAPQAPDRLLSVEEASEALGIGRSSTYELMGRGDLRSLKVGRRRLIAAADLAALIGRRAA
jgi:excisionase family DNA binding protein